MNKEIKTVPDTGEILKGIVGLVIGGGFIIRGMAIARQAPSEALFFISAGIGIISTFSSPWLAREIDSFFKDANKPL